MKMKYNRKFIFVGPQGSGKSRAVHRLKASPDGDKRYFHTRGTEVPLFEFGYVYDTGDSVSQKVMTDCDYCVLFGNNLEYAVDVMRHSPNVVVKRYDGMTDLKNWLSQL
jgi:GTPase SAR1 family protein